MSDEHANALIALSRKLRSVTPKELPIVDRGVLLAVAGRADADWIAFPPVEWAAREAGTTPNTARRALDRLVAAGWLVVVEQATARTSTRYRIQVDPTPPSGVTERYPRGVTASPQGCRSDTPGRGDGAAPQGSRSSTPGVTEQHPRGDGAAPADHRKIQDRSQKGPNAHEGLSDLPLFGPSGAAVETPVPGSRVQSKKKIKKGPPEKLAEDRYADAFEAGQKSQGFPITPLSASEKKILGLIAATHARYRDGSPITGKELVQWFFKRARDFRGDKPDTSFVRGGASPIGFRTWLDNGGDGKKPPLAPGQQEPPGLDEEPPLDPQDLPPPGYVEPTREELANTLERFGLHSGAKTLRERAKAAANG